MIAVAILFILLGQLINHGTVEVVPRTAEDGLELFGNLFYQGFDGAIL